MFVHVCVCAWWEGWAGSRSDQRVPECRGCPHAWPGCKRHCLSRTHLQLWGAQPARLQLEGQQPLQHAAPAGAAAALLALASLFINQPRRRWRLVLLPAGPAAAGSAAAQHPALLLLVQCWCRRAREAAAEAAACTVLARGSSCCWRCRAASSAEDVSRRRYYVNVAQLQACEAWRQVHQVQGHRLRGAAKRLCTH